MTGSLEPGKNADVVIWIGDPFSVYATPRRSSSTARWCTTATTPRGQPRSDFMLGILPSRRSRMSGSRRPGRMRAGALARQRLAVPRRRPPAPARPRGPVAAAPADRHRQRADSAGVRPRRSSAARSSSAAGRIAAVGATVAMPAGARVIDAAGKIGDARVCSTPAIQIGIVEIPLSAEGTADESTTDARVSAAFTVVDAFNGNSTADPGDARRRHHARAGHARRAPATCSSARAAVMDSQRRAGAGGGHARAGRDGRARSARPAPASPAARASTAILRLREILEDARDFARQPRRVQRAQPPRLRARPPRSRSAAAGR